ncbi:hypothetical protein Q3G72_024720 [Acer saccharum]|nr:hypothetical protein Q3G72_024720 [Acer saccharum]
MNDYHNITYFLAKRASPFCKIEASPRSSLTGACFVFCVALGLCPVGWAVAVSPFSACAVFPALFFASLFRFGLVLPCCVFLVVIVVTLIDLFNTSWATN